MSVFIWVLLGVTMSGHMQAIDIFPSELMCLKGVEYIQSLDERPANVFCVKMLLNPM